MGIAADAGGMKKFTQSGLILGTMALMIVAVPAVHGKKQTSQATTQTKPKKNPVQTNSALPQVQIKQKPPASEISTEDKNKINMAPLGKAVKIKVYNKETWAVKAKSKGGYYLLNDDEEKNKDKQNTKSSSDKASSSSSKKTGPGKGKFSGADIPSLENGPNGSTHGEPSLFGDFDTSFFGTEPASHPECRVTTLPPQINLNEDLFGPVREQSPGNETRGTCTAQTMANVATYAWNREHGYSKYFSANWIHMRAKEYGVLTGQETMDNMHSGSSINNYRDVNQTGFGGFMEESFFPYVNPLLQLVGQSSYVDTFQAPYAQRFIDVTKIPPDCSHSNAIEYRANVEKVSLADFAAIDFVKIKLCQDRPVYASFDYSDDMMGNDVITDNNYVLEAPPAGYESTGGHVMTIVGYDDDNQRFRVLNSWGDEWGDDGYFYMTYDAFVTLRRTYMLTIHEMQPYPPHSLPRPLLYQNLTSMPPPACDI